MRARSHAMIHGMHYTIRECNTLQHTATSCNTLQHTATHCACHETWRAVPNKRMQHIATHCNTLQHAATRCNTLQHTATRSTHCNALQHTATHCNTLQHSATLCNTLHTLQHSATLCNTLQRMARAHARMTLRDILTYFPYFGYLVEYDTQRKKYKVGERREGEATTHELEREGFECVCVIYSVSACHAYSVAVCQICQVKRERERKSQKIDMPETHKEFVRVFVCV